MILKTLQILFILLFLEFLSLGQSFLKEFPEKINNIKTDKHIRVKGTRVSFIFPDDYEYIKELARYQKNDKLYIQVLESNASSFLQAKPKLTKAAFEEKGTKVDILKKVNISGYDGIYAEGPSKYPDETKIGLFFGDDSFLVAIAGVCKTSDKTGLEELRGIIATLFYNRDIEINPLELANFTFDQSITGFKYSMTASNLFMYSENGKNDVLNSTPNSIIFAALPLLSENKAKEFAKDLLWRYEIKGISLASKGITETKINNYTAYILETNIEFESKKGILYQAVLIGKNSCVAFMGNAYSNLEDYLMKYKKTVASIKID